MKRATDFHYFLVLFLMHAAMGCHEREPRYSLNSKSVLPLQFKHSDILMYRKFTLNYQVYTFIITNGSPKQTLHVTQTNISRKIRYYKLKFAGKHLLYKYSVKHLPLYIYVLILI